MKKITFLFCIILMVAFSLAACAHQYTEAELTQLEKDISTKLMYKASKVEVYAVDHHLQPVIIYSGLEYEDFFGDIIVDCTNVCRATINQSGVLLQMNDSYGIERFRFSGFDQESGLSGIFYDRERSYLGTANWDDYYDLLMDMPNTTATLD